jgi:hypothetical protein
MTQPAARRSPGRKRFEPTPVVKRTVTAMLSYGIPQEEVALAHGIDAKTLRRHFPDEIRTAATQANAQVRRCLFRAATDWLNEVDDAGRQVGKPSKEAITAAIFWDKTRGGAVERIAVDAKHSGRVDSKVSGKTDVAVTGLPDPVRESARLVEELTRRLAGGGEPEAGLG